MYGYGQGMMSQAALLLDEMSDAEKFINLLVTHNYLPKMGKWICPEGIITHESEQYYLPVNGYMGQDSHLADSTKAVRLMIGIDDNKLGTLRLVPRFFAGWDNIEVNDMPFASRRKGGKISYTYLKNKECHSFTYSVNRSVRLDVRLGPFLPKERIVKVSLNGDSIPYKLVSSGDSMWLWICKLPNKTGKLEVAYL